MIGRDGAVRVIRSASGMPSLGDLFGPNCAHPLGQLARALVAPYGEVRLSASM